MAALKYTFEQWWSINGRPEWDSTMAMAAWNAAIESAEALKPSHNSESAPLCICGNDSPIEQVMLLCCKKCGFPV